MAELTRLNVGIVVPLNKKLLCFDHKNTIIYTVGPTLNISNLRRASFTNSPRSDRYIPIISD